MLSFSCWIILEQLNTFQKLFIFLLKIIIEKLQFLIDNECQKINNNARYEDKSEQKISLQCSLETLRFVLPVSVKRQFRVRLGVP